MADIPPVEHRSGRIAAIEVKAGQMVDRRALRGLRTLAEQVGDNFVRGLVLYAGDEVQELGNRISAWPIQALWQ